MISDKKYKSVETFLISLERKDPYLTIVQRRISIVGDISPLRFPGRGICGKKRAFLAAAEYITGL